MKLKQYGVWEKEVVSENGDVEDGGYWLMYDTIEDAVSEHGKVDVYMFSAKRLGQFRRAVKMVKIKKRRSAKKN